MGTDLVEERLEDDHFVAGANKGRREGVHACASFRPEPTVSVERKRRKRAKEEQRTLVRSSSNLNLRIRVQLPPKLVTRAKVLPERLTKASVTARELVVVRSDGGEGVVVRFLDEGRGSPGHKPCVSRREGVRREKEEEKRRKTISSKSLGLFAPAVQRRCMEGRGEKVYLVRG
jgi:hypothetical protein